jgi:hypothetical protein
MSSLKLIILILGLFSRPALANDQKESQEGAAPANENYSGKQDQHWEIVQTELGALKSKVDAQAVVVEGLMAQKSLVKGEELSVLAENIKQQHRKYEDLVLDYNKKNDEFLTRYPERGLKEKRVYKRVKMKSLNNFEADVSMKARMRRLHDKVLKQYPGVVDTQRSGVVNSPTHSSDVESSKKDVTEPIKFKK